MSDRLDMESVNWVNENTTLIAQHFPNCVTETANGIKIDFDLLKQELSEDIVEGNKERYRLEWPGKREAIVTANLPTKKTLRPVREDSVDFDNTENIYIEGDNLEVLKLLQESYLGKIKMIYIDPPYNTGNDFVYKDNFAKDKDEELFESGQKDELSQRLIANPETSGRYHSDWLNMMYPRLKLSRNLLSDDGAIFISIDDTELNNLLKVGDEIFGEGSHLASLIWKSRQTTDSRKSTNMSVDHEYIVIFTKQNTFSLKGNEIDKTKYSNPDNDPRGPWASIDLSVQATKDQRPNQFYDIVDPATGNSYPPNPLRVWSKSKNVVDQMINEGRILFPEKVNGRPREKKFIADLKTGLTGLSSILDSKVVGYTTNGTKELTEIFDQRIFDFPKSTSLISHLIEQGLKDGGTVLDFFSGSATTAHSVLRLNSVDNLKRNFILVQLPEITQMNGEAFKNGFKNICEIGKERIRRSGKKIKAETDANIDYGFRVYRLDESNMQDVYYRPQDLDQSKMDLFGDNVKPDRTEDDLLAQVMLDWGLPLSLRIEQVILAGKKVFKVDDNSLFACFDSGLDETFAKEIAKDKPLRIVFKDASFKDDTAKTNVKQLLKQLSAETEMKVI